MYKKLFMYLSIIMTIIIFFHIMFQIIIPNYDLSKLEKYKLLSNEVIETEFKVKNKKYVLTTYYDEQSSYGNNNLLIKKNNKYYLLEKIDNCDMNYYIKDSNIYIHCIGTKGNIMKYNIDGINVDYEFLTFNYTKTPNISQIHMTIDKIDNKYIYLKSVVKVDASLKEGNSIKCSLSTKDCEYNYQ